MKKQKRTVYVNLSYDYYTNLIVASAPWELKANAKKAAKLWPAQHIDTVKVRMDVDQIDEIRNQHGN